MKKSNFSKKVSSGTTNTPKDDNFKRDTSDNKIFKDIQVDDITSLITEDCVGILDADTPIWKACANQEVKFIRVKHKTEDVQDDMKNITTFRGRGNTISPKSWLGMKNLEREVAGLDPWSKDDFDIEELSELKDGKTVSEAVDTCKIQIHKKLKQLRQQYLLPKIKMVIGEGENFRHKLDLCRAYKGNRKQTSRPIILDEIRKWVVGEMGAILAETRYDGEMVEADDTVEYYGEIGYRNYRKTGKFNYVVLASDKDACNNPKLLINPDTYVGENNPLRGKFKFPQPMLIEASDRSAGDIEIITKESSVDFKFYGFKGLLFQSALSGDSSDNYNCLSHLRQDLNFGDEKAYAVLKPCKTAKEALQATIDTVYSLLPYGVQYITHDGRELDVDTMTYMNTYFLTAYMMRNAQDKMDFYKLCEAFKVDTSKIVGNNKLTPPQKVYVGDEEHVSDVESILADILKNDFKGIKALKKSEQGEVFDRIKEKLSSINFESHYEMKQFKKELSMSKIKYYIYCSCGAGMTSHSCEDFESSEKAEDYARELCIDLASSYGYYQDLDYFGDLDQLYDEDSFCEEVGGYTDVSELEYYVEIYNETEHGGFVQ